MSRFVDDHERYYPGDSYVEWIGINTFSNNTNPYAPDQNASLNWLLDDFCRKLHKKHPEKPIMLSMFGKAIGPDQPRWLINAYRSIKNDFPEVKAAIHCDLNQKIIDPYWTDSTLTQESVQTLKEIFKDPYWIMARM
jgi:beta-mannanase